MLLFDYDKQREFNAIEKKYRSENDDLYNRERWVIGQLKRHLYSLLLVIAYENEECHFL
ncbi:MAG: hypothetical protein JWR38_5397 [Mucilaginibacter sp.]|nr:hypothetical protein [Mucilaginibacter sp.]